MARFDLTGKSIVIIGGTTGIGLSAARAFIEHGARVVVVGRNPRNVKAAQKVLGAAVIGLLADARDSKTAARAVAIAVQKFGKLDGLYHVAGGSGRKMGDGPLHEVSDAGWLETLELNLTS